MRPDVSVPHHGGVDVERVALDDDVLDASDERGLSVDPSHGTASSAGPALPASDSSVVVDPRVTTDEQAVVSVG